MTDRDEVSWDYDFELSRPVKGGEYTHAVFGQCFLPIRKLPKWRKFYEVHHGHAAPAAENKSRRTARRRQALKATRSRESKQLVAKEVKSSKTGIPGNLASGNQISRRHLQRLRLSLLILQTWAFSDCLHFLEKVATHLPPSMLSLPGTGKRSSPD